MLEHSNTGVFHAVSRHESAQDYEPGSNLIGEAGGPCRARVQLALERGGRAVELTASGGDVVQVFVVGEIPERQWFLFKDLNFKRILRMGEHTNR
jgi:hypothetical protein